jgi:hypothetical protein
VTQVGLDSFVILQIFYYKLRGKGKSGGQKKEPMPSNVIPSHEAEAYFAKGGSNQRL